LSTAGTGDVLAGAITGMVSQGYQPLMASIFAIYLHGKSADLAIEQTGYQSLIATDVINGFGKAYLDLFAQPEQKVEEEGAEIANQEAPKQKNTH